MSGTLSSLIKETFGMFSGAAQKRSSKQGVVVR